MTDKTTDAGDELPPYLDMLRVFAAKAREDVEGGKQVIPMAFLIKDAVLIEVVVTPFGDTREKDGFAETVRQVASKSKPDAIVMLSEAWTLPKEYRTRAGYAEHKKKYDEIADAPYKVEIVMLKLETYDGEWLGTAEIQQVDGRRTFGEIDWGGGRPDHSEGRFSGLLPVIYATPKEVDDYVVLVRRKFTEAGIDPDHRLESGLTMLETIEATVRHAPADRLTEELLDTVVAAAKVHFWFLNRGKG